MGQHLVSADLLIIKFNLIVKNEMNKIIKCLLLLGLVQIPIVHAEYALEKLKGIWAGAEVMGCDKKTAQLVRSALAIEDGTPFSFNEEYFEALCEKAKRTVPEQEVKCAFIGYGDGKYYYNVEIVEKVHNSSEYRTIEKPIRPIQKLPEELLTLHEQWNNRFSDMLVSGNADDIGEHCENGCLNYGDQTLQDIATKLLVLCSKNNALLLETIRFSPDSDQRSVAATLLSWAKHFDNVNYILKWDLINDPDEGVRNDLTRSLSCTITKVKDVEVLNEMVSHLCKQASLPSHADRNKALSTLQTMLSSHPVISASINKECRNTITNISEMSILINAGGIAKDILTKIDDDYHA